MPQRRSILSLRRAEHGGCRSGGQCCVCIICHPLQPNEMKSEFKPGLADFRGFGPFSGRISLRPTRRRIP
ncbi:hypothetical protein ACFFX0_21355 [Citricoccus parietis]|uniref:Uncharacterized protein n=1 Tax=Citricoccus parietis TaxID=592307 RepID=A0ABV5G3T4_9MICC